MNEQQNVYHMLHPEMADPEVQQRNARRHDQEYAPTPTHRDQLTPEQLAQVWANTIEHQKEMEAGRATSASKVESDDAVQRLRERFAEEEKNAPMKREQEQAAKETETRAAAEMSFAFRNGIACRRFARAVIDISKVCPPFDQTTRAALPGYRAKAIEEMVQAVKDRIGPDAFTGERLAKEAAGFLDRMEHPVCGGGWIPTHAGVVVLGGATSRLGEVLNLWADIARQAEIDVARLEAEERFRQKELNMNGQRGFGALAYRPY